MEFSYIYKKFQPFLTYDKLTDHWLTMEGSVLVNLTIFPSHQSFAIWYITLVCSFQLQVLHYVEKPETFVSEIINCGIYMFSPAALFKLMGEVIQKNYRKMRYKYSWIK